MSKNKIILITGANAGIGYETALGVAKTGATTIMVGRDAAKCEQSRREIVEKTGNEQVKVILADLSSHQSIRQFTDEFKRHYTQLDVLINNAGGIFKERQLTPDGFERTFGLNHLGYFLTTYYLSDILTATPQSRLVNVASEAHRFVRQMHFDDLMLEKKYSEWVAYGQSKLANILFTRYLAAYWQKKGIQTTANCLHPGTVRSNFGKQDFWFIRFAFTYLPLFKTTAQGAKTSLHLALSPDVATCNGAYFDNCREKKTTKAAHDTLAMQTLWQRSLALTGIADFG
jgi:retinol dehydrogenase-12